MDYQMQNMPRLHTVDKVGPSLRRQLLIAIFSALWSSLSLYLTKEAPRRTQELPRARCRGHVSRHVSLEAHPPLTSST
jgi:hypothetical protein